MEITHCGANVPLPNTRPTIDAPATGHVCFLLPRAGIIFIRHFRLELHAVTEMQQFDFPKKQRHHAARYIPCLNGVPTEAPPGLIKILIQGLSVRCVEINLLVAQSARTTIGNLMQQVSCTQHLGIKKPELINSQVAQLLGPSPINFRTAGLQVRRGFRKLDCEHETCNWDLES